MKRLFLRFFNVRVNFRVMLMTLLLSMGLAACAPHPESADVTDTAQTRVPMPQKDGSYAMQVVELTGLSNLFELSGKFARFFLAPRITDGHLDGVSPRGHFVKSGSLYIASDALSLQLTTVYAHMQNFAALDTELGAGGLNKWPRDIGVGVHISGNLVNNAFYDGETDSMLFVPFVGNDLPIPVNAGILAHEHFHSLFYKLVMIPLQQTGQMSSRFQGITASTHSQEEFYDIFGLSKKSQSGDVLTDENSQQTIYHLLLSRGLNEGLADFWGWMYTDDTRFIEKSLKSEGTTRDLSVTAQNREESFQLYNFEIGDYVQKVRTWANNPKMIMARINGEAYAIGTKYSRIFKAVVEAHAQDRGLTREVARKEVARLILKTLTDYKESLSTLQDGQFYDPAQFLTSFAGRMGGLKQQECSVLSEILNINTRDTDGKFDCAVDAQDATARKLTRKAPAPIQNPPAAPVQSPPTAPMTPGSVAQKSNPEPKLNDNSSTVVFSTPR